MKRFILFFVMLLACYQAPAITLGEDPDLGDFDKIKADLVCGDKGGAFHINTKTEKVWQAELADQEGLPLTVTRFQRLRCPNCFNIDAEFEMMGQVVYYELKVRSQDFEERCNKRPIKMEVRLLKQGYNKKELVEKWKWTCK